MLFSAKAGFLWSFMLSIVVLLNPHPAYAQSACSSGVDCTTFKNTCLNSYCKAAGGGTNYTCPSPQECISPPDSKAHQCITPVVTPPTVDLRVNSVKSITVNSGDGVVLSWTTANTDPS